MYLDAELFGKIYGKKHLKKADFDQILAFLGQNINYLDLNFHRKTSLIIQMLSIRNAQDVINFLDKLAYYCSIEVRDL